MKTTRTLAPQFSKPARNMDRMGERQNKDTMDKGRYRGRLERDLPSLRKRADAVYQERRREKRGVLGWEVAYISNSERYNTLERSTALQLYINTHPLILFLYHNTAPPISNTSSISKTNGITIEAVPNRNRCYYNKYYKDFVEYSCKIKK